MWGDAVYKEMRSTPGNGKCKKEKYSGMGDRWGWLFCLGLPEKVTSEQRPEQDKGSEESGMAGGGQGSRGKEL